MVTKNNIDEMKIQYIVSVEKRDDNFEVEGHKQFTFVTEQSCDF